MLNLLAQTDFTTTEYDVSGADAGALAIFGGTFLVVWLVVAVVMIVSMWKVFEKAGRPGWAAIVPVYNGWVMAEIAGKPGWWALVPVLGVIPILGIIASLVGFVLFVLIAIELAKSFGKEPVFAALLVLLPIVGFPMLGFGDAKYVGAGGEAGATPAKTPVDNTPGDNSAPTA